MQKPQGEDSLAVNMNQLTGPKLKKELNLIKATKRYHNKNKSGGNFGIDLRITPKGKWFTISGYHNLDNEVTSARIGKSFNPGMTLINPNNYKFADYREFISTISRHIKTESILNKF